ncbi:universal stress protein [Pontiella sulfatireligans]|uniref:Universal stress protein n=1 Tax=Pontiella sulfatireligans TaxID=2750658 RepID=A0A6C2UT08_9BACT|nr:universal stress protein [Pontiella sulfatireligans]VGO22391.1 Putative universal stress protein [Pontiella sulfatireligans]
MKPILAAVDFSTTTAAVVEQAAALAKALGSKLWIIHASSDETRAILYDSVQFDSYSPEFSSMPGDAQLARDLSAKEIKREHAQLLGIASCLREKGVKAQAMLIKGDPAKLIIEKAEELEADMIIIGSHGHGLLHKALLGSVSESIIRHARCNVMVVPSAVVPSAEK